MDFDLPSWFWAHRRPCGEDGRAAPAGCQEPARSSRSGCVVGVGAVAAAPPPPPLPVGVGGRPPPPPAQGRQQCAAPHAITCLLCLSGKIHGAAPRPDSHHLATHKGQALSLISTCSCLDEVFSREDQVESRGLCSPDHQFGVHLSHKITPLPPVENFPTVIGLSIVRSSLARRRLPSRSPALCPLAALHSAPKA
jgi:hypothetical protein